MSATRTSILLVILITALTSSAQLFYKPGIDALTITPLLTLPFRILTNTTLLTGIILYALGAFLMIYSFRGGNVSTLYPIFSTSYIWVALLSWKILGETLTTLKITGILTIIAGVTLLALQKKTATIQRRRV